jgi:hypothetical protein
MREKILTPADFGTEPVKAYKDTFCRFITRGGGGKGPFQRVYTDLLECVLQL